MKYDATNLIKLLLILAAEVKENNFSQKILLNHVVLEKVKNTFVNIIFERKLYVEFSSLKIFF
ncbi:hypothetical protein SUT328_09130 [Streptococcus parasuis]|nr:hypothetical protein SUT328_09130 [Streptococcus parasuis]